MAVPADLYSPEAVSRSAYGFSAALTPVSIANVAGTVPAGGVGAAAGGWDTAGHLDTSITTLDEVITVLNDTLAQLAAAGLPITVT
jgi:hypothetical protein